MLEILCFGLTFALNWLCFLASGCLLCLPVFPKKVNHELKAPHVSLFTNLSGKNIGKFLRRRDNE